MSSAISQEGPASRIQNIQVLRFVAAALVVHAHSVDIARTSNPAGTSLLGAGNIENFGAIGVDIFFVISGFIITRTTFLTGRQVDAYQFALARWMRVAPFYFLLSLPWIVAALLRADVTLAQLVATFLFWPVSGTEFVTPFLPVGWTLCYEMLFYLAVFLILRFGVRTVPWLLMLTSVMAWTLWNVSEAALLRFIGNPIVLEFVVGTGIAIASSRAFLSRWIGWGALVTGLAWITALLIFGFGEAGEYEPTLYGENALTRLFLFGIPSALVVISAVALEVEETSRLKSILVQLGEASYSIYLVHLSILSALATVFVLLWPQASSDAVIAIVLLVSIVAGTLMHTAVERPLLQLCKAPWCRLKCSPPISKPVLEKQAVR